MAVGAHRVDATRRPTRLSNVPEATRPYLLVYDWACGQEMSLTPMSSEQSARLQRDEVASAYAEDASIEVSVVHAASPDAVRARLPRPD